VGIVLDIPRQIVFEKFHIKKKLEKFLSSFLDIFDFDVVQD
jgi:hypothetical protein